ncbi:zinc finger protein 334-like isoform X4 [Rhinatrema bivittatum]|uniref:zinc finger protein 334-like isoform X4 n=1 Tax=Rhinatrema bivittatum TaxID=194408 RepID=UPI0011277D01|nr:zinc finger protein 334-like isoform X4 [Rhinatrema bivittatum]
MASASVTFHDVTACFSEKQWQLLEEWQKQLYRSAMKEIHGTLISLGYMIVNPDVVFRIEKEEPYFRSCHDFEGQESIITHTSGSSANPDIVFRIEKKKELCFSDRYDTNTTATGSSVLNPDIFIRYRSNNKDPEERERVTLPTTKSVLCGEKADFTTMEGEDSPGFLAVEKLLSSLVTYGISHFATDPRPKNVPF